MGGTFPAGFRSVVFDCDSTLVAIEGIDQLAGPYAAEVQALTEAAMAGAVPLDEVYGRRLALIRPSRAQVEALGAAYLAALVPDAVATVAALLWLGREVRIISGGLRPPVEALAHALGLPPGAVGAVGIEFDTDGSYREFDRASPLARNGGKTELLRSWDLPRPVLLVGDGATDLEARAAVDAFAAFMGVAFRPAVANGADVVLRAPSLAPVLALACGPEDRERLRSSPWAGLLEHGQTLLGNAREHPGTPPAGDRAGLPDCPVHPIR